MLNTNLTEHDFVKGFFRHPTYLHIYVSKEGNVFNSTTARFTACEAVDAYHVVGSVKRPIHLLVLDTFRPIPEHLKGKVILGNHLNGIKTDNRVVNLEWTDHRGNAEHAFRTGLRTDNTPVLIKDIRTGEIVRYYGIHEAGRQHEVNGSNIHWYLMPKNYGKVFKKFFIVIHEGSQWPSEILTVENPAGPARQIYLEDHLKNIRVVFASIGQAARHLNANHQSLSRNLKKAVKKGHDGYKCEDYGIWYLDTYLANKNVSPDTEHRLPKKQVRVRSKPTKLPIPLIVTDLRTGIKENVASADEFANRLGVKRKTFQKHIYNNKGVWKGQYHVQYTSNPEVLLSSNT